MAKGDSPTVQRLVLLGFMGSGKSTVGAELARHLGWTFLDSDELVEARVGRTISHIFEVEGEASFRRVEHAVTLEQLKQDRIVLATGGGWPAVPGRMGVMGGGSVTVYLEVPASELVARLARDPGSRPLLAEASGRLHIEQLLHQRVPYYREAAIVVDADGTPDVVVGRILARLPGLDRRDAKTRTQESKT